MFSKSICTLIFSVSILWGSEIFNSYPYNTTIPLDVFNAVENNKYRIDRFVICSNEIFLFGYDSLDQFILIRMIEDDGVFHKQIIGTDLDIHLINIWAFHYISEKRFLIQYKKTDNDLGKDSVFIDVYGSKGDLFFPIKRDKSFNNYIFTDKSFGNEIGVFIEKHELYVIVYENMLYGKDAKSQRNYVFKIYSNDELHFQKVGVFEGLHDIANFSTENSK